MADESKTQQIGKKRERDESAPLDVSPRDLKRSVDHNGDPSAAPSTHPFISDAPAAGQQPGDVPKPQPGLTASKDENMFYPENYDKFDPNCLVADGDPQNSKIGGGKMLFLKYMNKERGVSYPLCVQGPKLFLPAGIKEYQGEGNKVNTNALCSFGREWEANPTMVAFRRLCDKIQGACVRLIINKSMHLPYCQKEEDVQHAFSPIVGISEKAAEDDPSKLIVYPPSFKLVINTAPNNRTLLVTRITTSEGMPAYGEISHQGVIKGACMIPMINFQWVYRRKRSNPNGWAFSMHASAYQAIVEPPSTMGVPSGASSSKLTVVL